MDRKYKIGQRIKIEFYNDFHNTYAVGIAKITQIGTEEIFMEIGYSAAKRIERKLCGMSDCYCGSLRGRHEVQATGQNVGILCKANRDGTSRNGQRPENPMELVMDK